MSTPSTELLRRLIDDIAPTEATRQKANTLRRAIEAEARQALDVERLAVALRDLGPAPDGGYGYIGQSGQNLAAAIAAAYLRAVSP